MKEGFGMKLKIKQNKLMENLNYAISGISYKVVVPTATLVILLTSTIAFTEATSSNL